jgi:hypothetical protein
MKTEVFSDDESTARAAAKFVAAEAAAAVAARGQFVMARQRRPNPLDHATCAGQ